MIKIKNLDAWRQGGRPATLCGGALATAVLARSAESRPAAPAPPASLIKVLRPDYAGHTVGLVQVRAVTRPDGTPAATGSVACRSVYATQVTVTTAGRATGSDGIILRLARSGARWLVSAVLSL